MGVYLGDGTNITTHKFPAFPEKAKNVNIAEYMASKNNTTEEKVKTSILDSVWD